MNTKQRLLTLLTCLCLLSSVPPQAGADDDEDLREKVVEIIQKSVTASVKNAVDRTGFVTTKADREAAKKIRRVLKTRKVTVNFDGTSFDDAIDFIRDITSLNIVVSKDAQSIVKDKGLKVKLKLKKIQLRSCLIHMLQCLDDELCFGVRQTVLMIGTKDEFKAKSVTLRIHDLGDIGKKRPDFPAPRIGLDKLNKKD